MDDDANPWPTRADDEARLLDLAQQLADAVDRTLGEWVERCVVERGGQWDPDLAATLAGPARRAGEAARRTVGRRVRELLETDVDEQRTNPLAVLRSAVVHPTAVLRDAEVPPVVRDDFAEAAFPDDVYDLSPATWADVHPELHDLGLAWSAAKAFVVKARRRAGDGSRREP